MLKAVRNKAGVLYFKQVTMCFLYFSEQDNNETECWKQRVDLFVDESLSPAVKSCIESYARASERNEYYSGIHSNFCLFWKKTINCVNKIYIFCIPIKVFNTTLHFLIHANASHFYFERKKSEFNF